MRGRKILSSVSELEETDFGKKQWEQIARSTQLPPDGYWRIWLLMAGRGFGKTRAGAETIKNWIDIGRYHNIALIANSIDEARGIMVEGPSGILTICGGSSNQVIFEPSKRKLTWDNGAVAHLFSAENYEKLRGPQFDLIWIDELAKFPNAEETMNQAMLTLRIGTDPKMIITTTPRSVPLMFDLVKRPNVVVTKGSTYENIENLAPEFINQIKDLFEDTELGRQELHAELLSKKSVYLWDQDLLEAAKKDIKLSKKGFAKTILSVDPALTAHEDSDETGIIMAGINYDGIIYVMDDFSTKSQADEWTDLLIGLYHKYSISEIIVEVNAGGDLIEQLIHAKDRTVTVNSVFAKQSKILRAEPMIPLYKQGKVKHLKTLEKLEKQMLHYTSKNKRGIRSPDRMDALIWAIHRLKESYANLPKITLIT